MFQAGYIIIMRVESSSLIFKYNIIIDLFTKADTLNDLHIYRCSHVGGDWCVTDTMTVTSLSSTYNNNYCSM